MTGYLRGNLEFNFGPTITLDAGESVLMVPFDPILSPATAASFRSEYQVPAATRLMGPWSSGFLDDATGGQDLVLEYLLRRDRTDFPLVPMSSTDLIDWQPAADDRHHGFDDLYEIRRTHLPIDSASGYLRLQSPVDD